MLHLNFDPLPVLTTPRLVLRQITLDDVPAMFTLRSDSEVMRHIARPVAKSPDDAARHIQTLESNLTANEGITWGLALRDQSAAPDNPAASPPSVGSMLGTIGFWHMLKEDLRAEIGYALIREHWGQGLMQEALAAVLAYGFEVMKLHSVEAVVAPRNRASIQLLLRNGFVQEGLFRENCFFEGEFLDSAVFSLLGAHWGHTRFAQPDRVKEEKN